MDINRALKIAFKPVVGTAIFLAVVAIMAVVQFAGIEAQTPTMTIAYTLGYLFFALSLKLILSAVFGVFVETIGEALPRGAMFILAFIFLMIGLLLLVPLLDDFIR